MKRILIAFACLFMLLKQATARKVNTDEPIGLKSPKLYTSNGFSSNATTVAGGNGAGSSANQLSQPAGIFIDGLGNLYVTDQGNHRIQQWTPGAIAAVTVAGGNGVGTTPTQLNYPFDVFVDAAGNIFIDEANGARVQKWAMGASSGITVAGGNGRGSAADQLNDPFAIYLDASGNIYIADLINNRIQKWAPGATQGVTVAGGNGNGSAPNQLNAASAVFVDAAGNIYAGDALNNRVQKWAPNASLGVTVAGGNGLGSAANQVTPSDIYVDQGGNIFIVDGDNNRVQKWAPGALQGVTVAGGNGQGAAANQLNHPGSIYFDQAGNLYVSDNGNNRVQKYSADLTFTATSCNATAIVSWPEYRDTFPASIAIPEELDLYRGMLTFMGTMNGHGYYKSSLAYTWPVAKDISFYIGDTSVNGHLLTIGSAAENNFIYTQLKNTGYSPWIGLYNSGKPGQFAWVTGESFSYTNWAANEPNNTNGNGRYIKEPYVRLMDGYGNWNDQRSDNVPFITEFESPLIRNKQLSGPANGSAQPVGTYEVCYEKVNAITSQKETACFTVHVICNTVGLNLSANSSAVGPESNSMSATSGGLSISSSPNPSSRYFKLKITSSQPSTKVDVVVMDIAGKIVETKRGIMPYQAIEIGANYKPGIYITQVNQGNDKVMLRVVKQ